MNRPSRWIVLLTALSFVWVSQAAADFPDDWYFDRPEEHTKFEGIEAPELTVGEWVGPAFDPAKDMEGSIVVIDFWATWCQPCIAAIPHNNKIAKKYADDGVKFVAVCLSGDAAQMPKILKDNKAEYASAFVQGDQVAEDWPVQWYPTYAVVDRKGVVRAIGLKPDRIEDVIESILSEEAEAAGRVRVRPVWLEGDKEKRGRLAELEAAAANPPALQVDGWKNSEPIKLESLKGKVVVLDFWATWAGPSVRAIEYHNELVDKYGEQGLVFIGVCATLGGESLDATIEKQGINYPVCVDVDNKTSTAYKPNGFPDYYLIDKAGKLRIADCANASLEDAIKALLDEKIQVDGAEKAAQ